MPALLAFAYSVGTGDSNVGGPTLPGITIPTATRRTAIDQVPSIVSAAAIGVRDASRWWHCANVSSHAARPAGTSMLPASSASIHDKSHCNALAKLIGVQRPQSRHRDTPLWRTRIGGDVDEISQGLVIRHMATQLATDADSRMTTTVPPETCIRPDDAADGALSANSRYGRQGVDRVAAGAVR